MNSTAVGKSSFIETLNPAKLGNETPDNDIRTASRTSGNHTLPIPAEDVFLRKNFSYKSK